MTKRNAAVPVILWTYLGLAASAWILQLALPTTLPGLETETLVYLLVVVGVGAIGVRWEGVGRESVWQAIGSGLLLFALPSLVLAGSAGRLPGLTQVALLGLVPVVLVVISAVSGSSSGEFPGLLGAALAGLAGGFLLLAGDPEMLLQRPVAGALFAMVIVSIACGSYFASVAAKVLSLRALLLLLVGPSLVLSGAVGFLRHSGWAVPRGQDIAGLVWRAAAMVLLVYLIKHIAPVALAARFLLIPLITAVEGFAYMRPSVSWRQVLGMTLLALGSARLLVRGGSREEPRMSLL